MVFPHIPRSRFLLVFLPVTILMLASVAPAEERENPPERSGKSTRRAASAEGVDLGKVTVAARRPVTAASSDEVRSHDYELRPHQTTMEILNNVQGLVVAQHQGGGKAPQYLVRGFNADHGTDFAVAVDGLPVNLPTHGHGQGYADLNFLIPETVERFTLRKGPYFADLGDFANAGAIDFVTRDRVDENIARVELGSFNTQRYVAVVSPQMKHVQSLFAGQLYLSDGPFEHPQNYTRYNFFSKFTLQPATDSKLSLSAGIYDGRWDASGQIPLRAVSAGALALAPDAIPGVTPQRPFGRFDAIDPSEGGSSDRENLNLHYRYTPRPEEEWSLQVYGSRYKMALYSNFTFYKDTGLRFYRQADGTICDSALGSCENTLGYLPGDGIEQNDMRWLYGARGRYTRDWAIGAIPAETQIGIETRNDEINVALWRQIQRRRFYAVNKLNVEERSVSGFLQQQFFFTDWARLEAGLRGDVFFFDGHNRLPVQGEDPNFTPTYIDGNSVDSIVSPKANLILTPLVNTDVYFNFGNGFHSNDARNVLLTRSHPDLSRNVASALARSTGYEVGSRTRLFDRLDLAASLWLLDLESELVFSGDAGNQETGAGGTFQPSGPTRRWGVDFETRLRALSWLFIDYDLSYSDPRYRVTGEAIPLAPTLLMNGGFTADFGNGLSGALRMRYLEDRPANEDRTLTARGYFLMDLLAQYRWRNLAFSVAVLNLTNTDWREAQFSDTSCVLGEVGRGECLRAPGKQGEHDDPPQDIHFTPGNPIAARGGFTLFF